MGFKNAVEPLIIALIFTTTTIVNRSKTRGYSRWWQQEAAGPETCTPLVIRKRSPSPEPRSHSIQNWLPYPDNRRFHTYPLSRFLHKFPFLLEIGYWGLIYWPYQFARARTALWISSNPERKEAIFDVARSNAIRILKVEAWLGINIEQRVQNFILNDCQPWVMKTLCKVYVAHIIIGILFLGYSYTYFSRKDYQRIRRTIAIDNWLAFVVLSVYRCMPPRLMPPSYGFDDVLHPHLKHGVDQPVDWNNNRFQLTIAAMPSLHFGTSLLLGSSIAVFGRHALLRTLAPLYPAVMLLVVIATANHWVLDCVAGVLVVGLGFMINPVMLVFRPIEEWLFWLARTEKPKPDVVEVKLRGEE